MDCPICDRSFKGKIGVGVHLKRSHTSAERGVLFLSQITNLIPLLLAVVVVRGCGLIPYILCEERKEVI